MDKKTSTRRCVLETGESNMLAYYSVRQAILVVVTSLCLRSATISFNVLCALPWLDNTSCTQSRKHRNRSAVIRTANWLRHTTVQYAQLTCNCSYRNLQVRKVEAWKLKRNKLGNRFRALQFCYLRSYIADVNYLKKITRLNSKKTYWTYKRVLNFCPKTFSYLFHGAEPFLRSRQLCTYTSASQHFMKFEGSLPCSQEPSTGPYPEPDQFSPYHSILSL
jgi:hypothetical protein